MRKLEPRACLLFIWMNRFAHGCESTQSRTAAVTRHGSVCHWVHTTTLDAFRDCVQCHLEEVDRGCCHLLRIHSIIDNVSLATRDYHIFTQ
jgi:hypothetical protein